MLCKLEPDSRRFESSGQLAQPNLQITDRCETRRRRGGGKYSQTPMRLLDSWSCSLTFTRNLVVPAQKALLTTGRLPLRLKGTNHVT